MGAILSFITSKFAGPLFGVAALALGVMYGVQAIRIADLRDQINNPKTGYIHQLDIAKANAITWKSAADACSASVAGLKPASDKLTSAANELLDVLGRQRGPLDRRVAAILAARLKPGADKCKAADQIITGTIP